MLSASRLHLNPDKTVIMWLGSRHQVEKVTIHNIPVMRSSMTTVDAARDLEWFSTVSWLCRHIPSVLRQLHWLPVRQCIEFKVAILVYKALNGLSPQYLADDCQLITTTGRLRLRSSNVATFDVPQSRTTLGDWFFTAAGPYLWNNLPLHLRDFELSLFEFRQLLKTHLFGWGPWRLVTYFRCSALYKCLERHVLMSDHTVQFATHTFIHQWN